MFHAQRGGRHWHSLPRCSPSLSVTQTSPHGSSRGDPHGAQQLRAVCGGPCGWTLRHRESRQDGEGVGMNPLFNLYI